MINITNIINYDEEKEFMIAIPNRVFLGFEYDSLREEEKEAEMQISKIIHLYYSLVLLTPFGINRLDYMYLSTICSVTKVKPTSSTLKSIKKRLSFLENQGLIRIYGNLRNLKKNDEFSIEVIITKGLLKNGFTFLNAEERDLFFNLDVNTAVIFLYLKRHINNKTKYAFTSYQTMAEELGVSNATLTASINFLSTLGIVIKENPNFISKDKFTGQIRKSNNTYYIAKKEVITEVNRKFKYNEFEVTKAIRRTKPKEVVKEVKEEIIVETKEEVKIVHMEHGKEIEIPFPSPYLNRNTNHYLEIMNDLHTEKETNGYPNMPNEIPF